MDEINSWDRQPREPVRWYDIFVRYYLASGLSRTVRVAFLAYVKDTKPEAFMEAQSRRGAPGQWMTMADRWHWRERAAAWEQSQTDLAMATIEQAARKLRLLTVNAVDALEIYLTSQRLGVQAAKEILDRGGLPATTRVESDNVHRFTADDLAKARDELKEWQTKE